MGNSKAAFFPPQMLLAVFFFTNSVISQVNCSDNNTDRTLVNSHKIRTVKADQGSLVITEVSSNENCLTKGQPFIIETRFKYRKKKFWAVKLNNTEVKDLKNVVFDSGRKATVRITSGLYGRYGNTTLEIIISDKEEKKILTKNICVRFQSAKVEVSVTTAAARGAIVKFYIESENPSNVDRRFSIGFGDRTYGSSYPLLSPLDNVERVYRYRGTYEYDWVIYVNSIATVTGVGTIKVVNAVKDCFDFSFSTAIAKDWPQNRIQFWMRHLCYNFQTPDEATYRIHFGDGEITAWLPLPRLRCSRYAFLVQHTYKLPGCYDTWFEMKNLLGWCHYRGFVWIQKPLSTLTLEVKNKPLSKRVEKEVEGSMATYLRKRDPFEVEAITTGGRCRTYDWKIINPYWHRSSYEVDKTVISHLSAGTYDLEVTVSNKVSSLVKMKRIVLIDTITELSLLASDPIQNGKIDIYLLVKEHGDDTQFFWDFGNGETISEKNPSFTPAKDLPNINQARGSESINLESYVGLIKPYTYGEFGTYIVNVTGVDTLVTLEASRTVYISKRVCRRPVVKILKEKKQTHLIFDFRESFTILTNVTIECDDSSEAVFHWSIFKSSKDDLDNNRLIESDKVTKFPADVVTNQREITIQKRTLNPEIYQVKLEVSMKALGYSEADEAFLEISAEPLYVRIEGGSTRLMSWQEKIFFDGSSSYDPNVLQGNAKNFIYKWYCRVKPGSLHFVIGSGGCFGHGHNLIEHHEATWTVNEETFIRNAVYIVKLVVESRTSPERSGFFEQYVDIQAGTFMKTSIQCKTNCQDRLDPQTRLSLIGSCENCGRFVNYKWNLLDKSTLKMAPIDWMSDTRTPQQSISFVLLPGILAQSKEYLARFTAITPTGEEGYNDYGIALSSPPYGGNCNVTPSTGEAVKTQFYISCHGWKTNSVALKYSMSLIKNSAVVGAVKDNSESTLLSYGPLPYTTAKLPEGQRDRDYKQLLDIRVIDSYGASYVTNITVKVLPFTADENSGDDTPLESELETYVHGKDSTLAKLSGSGDLQGLGRFTKSIGKSLDTAKKESEKSSVLNTLKEKRRKKRENMRESIVDSLTDLKVTTLDNFGLISSALEKVSVSPDELSKSSQDKLLKFYDSSCKFMDESYSQWGERDPKEIQDAYGGFLEGVANVMSSTVLKRSGTATKGKDKADYLKFTEDALRIIENSTSILFRSMVANEIAKRISSESISVEMKRSEEDRLGIFHIQTLEGGKLKTPSKKGIFRENQTNNDVIDMKMVSLSRNPFTWDKGSIGKVISPSVSSVKYIVNGNDVPVTNLPAGDEVVLELPTPNLTLVNRTAKVNPGEFHVIRMNLSAVGLTVMLKTGCYKNACRVFIRYGGIPSPSTYSDSFDLSKDCADNDFRRYSRINHTTFNLGIWNPSRNSSNPSYDDAAIFEMLSYTTGCFYWKEDDEVWSSAGCKISNETNPSKTVCICNHLTWFGAGILVQPTIIDPKKEILKIKRLDEYPALLAAVCLICGLYLIAMIWARHRDRKDVLKTALTIVESCCQTHRYRYDVTIYTGSRPGAGTSSCVCMILGGSNGESDPYCLSNRSKVLFQRGNVDSFLVTNEEDLGKIKWIRIWHDNTGKSASWFLSRIIITDIVRGTQATFICHTWLGIGVDDGQIDRIFLAADEEESKNFATLFLTKTARGFSDDHLWFSVAMRPSRSHFTRCQRVSCCLATLLCTMLANAMFYQRTAKVGTEITLGSFSFSWHQIAIGVESALIVIPINLLIVNLFRKAAPSVRYASEEEEVEEKEVEEEVVRVEEDDVNLNEEIENVEQSEPAQPTNEVKSDFHILEIQDPANVDCIKSPLQVQNVLNSAETNSRKELVVKEHVHLSSDAVSHDTLNIIDLLGALESSCSNYNHSGESVAKATDLQYNDKKIYMPDADVKDYKLEVVKNSKHNGLSLNLKYLDTIGQCRSVSSDKRNLGCSKRYLRSRGNSRGITVNPKSKSKSHLNSKINRSSPRQFTQQKPPSRNGKHQAKSNSVLQQAGKVTTERRNGQKVESNAARPKPLAETEVSRENIIITIESSSSFDGNTLETDLSNDELDLCGFLNDKHDDKLETASVKKEQVHHTISKNILRDILHRKKSEDIQDEPKKQNGASLLLPHWCLYFGWIVCFLTTFVAGFFTLLYGLSFGRVVQEEWLVSLLTSMFQDIFVSQPTKVIVLSCIFAFILKKLSVDEHLPEIKLAKNEKWIKNNLPLQDKRTFGSRVKIPRLTDSYVRKAEEEKLKQATLSEITVEIAVYFFYIFLALLIAYGHRSPNAFIMGNNIQSLFISKKFDQVQNVNDFWTWMDKYFLPSVYEENWYNGEATHLDGYLADRVTMLIGRPRIRQLRAVQGPCKISGFNSNGGKTTCRGTLSDSNEDKADYFKGWKKNGPVPDSLTISSNKENPWRYSHSDFPGNFLTSKISSFQTGGYLRTLGKTSAETNSTILYLKENLWLDTKTRALFVEFTTYNNNDNFYCIVSLAMDFSPTGGVTPYPSVITTKLDRYNTQFSFFLAACEISFLLLTLYYMRLEFRVFQRKGFAYIREYSTLVELLSFGITWASFGLFIIRHGVVSWTKMTYKENPDGFTSFQQAAYIDIAYGYAFAAVVVIAFLKILKILRFNNNMLLLLMTLKKASSGIKNYFLFIGIAFAAFTQWAYLSFGQHLPDYATFLESFMTILNLLLGAPQLNKLVETDRIFGPVFFIWFVFLISFVLMNLFLAMLMDAFSAVRKELSNQPNQLDILEFLHSKFADVFPFLKKLINVDSQLSGIEQYYENRHQQRKGDNIADNYIGSLVAKIDNLEQIVDNFLLTENEELKEFALLAFEIRMKTK